MRCSDCYGTVGQFIADRDKKCEPIKLALIRLVELKKYKDIHGKDEYYKTNQPLAWAEAIKALGERNEHL